MIPIIDPIIYLTDYTHLIDKDTMDNINECIIWLIIILLNIYIGFILMYLS